MVYFENHSVVIIWVHPGPIIPQSTTNIEYPEPVVPILISVIPTEINSWGTFLYQWHLGGGAPTAAGCKVCWQYSVQTQSWGSTKRYGEDEKALGGCSPAMTTRTEPTIARGGAAQSKILNSYEGPPAIRTILHSINLMHMLLSLWGTSS